MRAHKVNIYFSLFFLAMSTLCTKAQNNTCINEVKQLYKELSDWSINYMDTKKPGTFHFAYAVKTVLKDSTINDRVLTDNVDMWVSGSLMEIHSSNMSIYQDSKEVFTVIPDKKLVVRSDAIKDYTRNKTNSLVLQDSVFNRGKLKSCKEIKPGIKEVILSLDEAAIEDYGIKGLEFTIDKKENRIVRVLIHYESSQGSMAMVKNLEYVFKVMKNEPDKKMNTNVSKYFMGSRSELNKQYGTYKLVDSRGKA